MPAPGKLWRHITVGTYASWLPGSPKGWRSRNHKRHSSGEHRHPPPPDEHAGLHEYSRRHSGPRTLIPASLRPLIGRRCVAHFQKLDHRLLALSVGGLHLHALAELPISPAAAKHEIGRCKQAAALAVTQQLAGRKLWAKDCGCKPVRDRMHSHNTYQYICDHFDEGAWVWTFRDGEWGMKGKGE